MLWTAPPAARECISNQAQQATKPNKQPSPTSNQAQQATKPNKQPSPTSNQDRQANISVIFEMPLDGTFRFNNH
jgi:hypothetical protein